MKKLFLVSVALIFALSLAAAALAETKAGSENPAEPAKSTEPMKADSAGKTVPMKKVEARETKSHRITGMVEAVDDAAGTLTVKGKRASVSLKAGEKVKLAKIHVGDKVLVHYRGDTAHSVKKVTARKAAPKKTANKEIAPASSAPASAGK
jgi:hypothetical protein